jgi:hypothetical protein
MQQYPGWLGGDGWNGEQIQKMNQRGLPADMCGRQADPLLNCDVDQVIAI